MCGNCGAFFGAPPSYVKPFQCIFVKMEKSATKIFQESKHRDTQTKNIFVQSLHKIN